ncbi:hypothetical protein KKC88_04995 [Patescibacteria group bacterium]|nr:hypothetical protein [Patescibacteria group bacterium]MBU1673258.1 hypothetical protein [Patescibacteria group bacterium]MBU1963519.1 hypothetical protein [Patescibacteria group bacterium]
MKFERQEPKGKIDVDITQGEKVGSGHFGDVYLVEGKIGNHKKEFVIKRYKDDLGDSFDSLMDAKKAFSNHSKAKKAGLKVFPTYRLSEDKNSILMTSAAGEGKYCLAITIDEIDRSYVDSKGFENIKEIPNFEELANNIFKGAVKAAENNIFLYMDSYFFMTGENEDVDYVIGDLDLVYEMPDVKSENLNKVNLKAAKKALDQFLATYTDCRDKYKPELEEIFSAYLE